MFVFLMYFLMTNQVTEVQVDLCIVIVLIDWSLHKGWLKWLMNWTLLKQAVNISRLLIFQPCWALGAFLLAAQKCRLIFDHRVKVIVELKEVAFPVIYSLFLSFLPFYFLLLTNSKSEIYCYSFNILKNISINLGHICQKYTRDN